MSVLQEDVHSLAQREAARNRRAERIMAWVAGVAVVLTIAGIWAGVL